MDSTSFERTFRDVTGCYPLGSPALYFFIWIPLIVFETILCSLMLYKAWRAYKEDFSHRLLILLIRDNFLYFFTILLALLVNCIVSVLAPQIVTQVAMGWAVAVPCSLGSRLLLNMREQYFKEEMTTAYDTSQTEMEMHAVRPRQPRNSLSFALATRDTGGISVLSGMTE